MKIVKKFINNQYTKENSLNMWQYQGVYSRIYTYTQTINLQLILY